MGDGEGTAGRGGDEGEAEKGEDEYNDEEYAEEYDDNEVYDGEDNGFPDNVEQDEDEHKEKVETKQTEHANWEVEKPDNNTHHEIIPNCLFCKKQGMPAQHWMSGCRKMTMSSSKAEL